MTTSAISPRKTSADVRVEVISDRDHFQTLAGDWDRLLMATARPTPYALHAWLACWWRYAMAKDTEVIVAAARRDGELVGALPLAITRFAGLRRATLLGGARQSHRDLLLAPDEPVETARALLDELRPSFDWFSAFGLLDSAALVAAAPPETIKLIRSAETATRSLTGSTDSKLLSMSSRHLAELGRRRRRLAQEEGLNSHLANDPEEAKAYVEAAFAIHAAGWAGRADTSGFLTARSRRFLEEVVDPLLAHDNLHFLLMRTRTRPVAFRLNLVVGNRMFAYRSAFDPTYRAYSLGWLALQDSLRHAASRGIAVFELGAGTNEQKQRLAERWEPVAHGIGLGRGRHGRALAEIATLDRRLRNLLQHRRAGRATMRVAARFSAWNAR